MNINEKKILLHCQKRLATFPSPFPLPWVVPEIAATGGFSACDITITLLYKITKERGDIGVIRASQEGKRRTLWSAAFFLTAASWTSPLGGWVG